LKHLSYSINLYNFFNLSDQKIDLEKFKYTLWNLRDRKINDKYNNLFVIPTIDIEKQYSSSFIDLRLGNIFYIGKVSKFSHISEQIVNEVDFDEIYEKVVLSQEEDFILHPHQFVLAHTLEYISLPNDYFASVLGRSTWGRLGLTIATAVHINAGFKGSITLELRNLGETPLSLKVGTRVAQLAIYKLNVEASKAYFFEQNSKYIAPVSVESPKLKSD